MKEAPKLVEYAIMRGWMAYPKKAKYPDHWSNGKDLSDEDVQELRKTLTEGSGH